MTKKLPVLAVTFMLAVGSLMADTPAKPMEAAKSAAPVVAAKPPAKMVQAAPAANDEAGIQALFQGLTDAWTAGDAKLAAGHWLKDGSLISPMGQEAWNREDVEKIVGADIRHFGGTNTFSDFKINEILKGGFALVDAKAVISGLKNADGTAAPDLEHHVYGAVVNRGGKWYFKALRPYLFVQPPAAAAPAAAEAAPAAPAVDSGDAKKDSKKKKDAPKE